MNLEFFITELVLKKLYRNKKKLKVKKSSSANCDRFKYRFVCTKTNK